MKNIISFIKLYGTALFTFLVIDLLWIGLFANDFYRSRLGYLLSDTPNITAAVIFYLLFVFSLVFLAVLPGIKSKSMTDGLIRSAVFGLITYGTYDLTNLALVKDWPLSVTIVDMIWGVAVSIAVGSVSLVAGKYFIFYD